MKIEKGEWAGWEVWVEYTNGVKPLEHNPTCIPARQGTNPTLTECRCEVLFECEHGKDFRIAVKPPLNNKRQFIGRLHFDGEPISSRIKVEKEWEYLTVERMYGEENGVAVEKSLRFAPLKRDPNRPYNQSTTLQSLGTITVVLSIGFATRDSIRTPLISKTPASTVNEKVKNVTLTSVVGGETLKKCEPMQLWSFKDDPAVPKCRIAFSLRLSKGAAGTTNNPGTASSNDKTSVPADATKDDSDDDITVVEDTTRAKSTPVVDLTNDTPPCSGTATAKAIDDSSSSEASDTSDSDSSDDDYGLDEGQRTKAVMKAITKAKTKVKRKAKLKYKLKLRLKKELKAEMKAKAERKAARRAAKQASQRSSQSASSGK